MSTSQRGHVRTILYALGSNGNGQLGISHDEDVSNPAKCVFQFAGVNTESVPLREHETITKVVGGGNHTLLLTSFGAVWSTGSNEDGQRGLERREEFTQADWKSLAGGADEDNRPQSPKGYWTMVPWTDSISLTHKDPRLMTSFVTDIAAGWSTSYFVVDADTVYSCGLGLKGELGIGPDATEVRIPRKCFQLRDFESGLSTSIKQIKSCVNHVVVLSDSGRLYGWGASRKGQLGQALQQDKVVSIPQEIDIGATKEKYKKMEQISVGRDFTFATGTDRKDQVFLGDKAKLHIDQPSVTESDASSMHGSQTHAAWTSLVTLYRDGNVRVLGPNHRSLVSCTTSQELLHNVEALAVGSEHCLALTKNGSVIAWGWGEHGNCGNKVDPRGHVTGHSNVLWDRQKTNDTMVAGVAAGCATSFFWISNTKETIRS